MPELYFQDYPGSAGGEPLVMLHGLFGSGTNWRGIAKRLGGGRRILAMDMRNHGRSFNDSEMTYPAMARDVLDTLDAAGIDRADLLGHSMGGKAAMVAGLENPERVRRLIVVDIAPVVYSHTHLPLIDAMMRLDVSTLGSRSQADQALERSVADPMTRQFLLQSLEKVEQGYRWRLNLEALRHAMDDLVGFPDLGGRTYEGPALFVRGADSEYIQAAHHSRIEHYFPEATHAVVENAGHWVHADQPGALAERVARFLSEGA